MNAITAALSLGALLTVGQVPNTVITYQYSPLQPTSIAAPAGSTVLVVVQPPGGLATGYQYFTTSVTTVGCLLYTSRCV